MRLIGAFLLLLASSSTASILPSAEYPLPRPFSELADESTLSFRIPSVHDSAVQARRILRKESIGTLSTVFPSSSPTLGGAPIGLMDYYADCEDDGNPTILALSIATSFKNVAAGSNITMSLRWHPNLKKYGAASMPRFSLVGHLETMSAKEGSSVVKCFTKAHPDAVWWLPGNRIHESYWTRLVVDEIYWIGGFGDRAYIGWIPVEEWKNVTKEEINDCTLPGEKSWSFW